MEEIFFFVGVGAVAFLAANVDNLLILVSFLADRSYGTWQVAQGYALGALAVLTVLLLLSEVRDVLPVSYLRYLGAIPFVLGVKGLFDLVFGEYGEAEADSEEASEEAAARVARFGWGSGVTRALTVAFVTLSSSGDTIATFVPLMIESNAWATVSLAGVFAAMAAVWFGLALHVLRYQGAQALIQHYGRYLLPFLLMGLGLYIYLDTAGDVVVP